MTLINRRSLIAGFAALPATAAPGRALPAPEASSIVAEPRRAAAGTHGLRPADRLLHHWRQFVAAMAEIDPSVERWTVCGTSSAAYVRGMQALREDVGHGLGDVDCTVYSGCLTADALWRVEVEA
ncbi:hypothetical protein ACSBOB_14800 [Mesorhizobium sp. ASY16-5R]|uniref:hypothetical protein n=1 Tax=Mesorhizobium sp. ASY16-5R TaxID=3445772 RepID=UPI003FA0EC21